MSKGDQAIAVGITVAQGCIYKSRVGMTLRKEKYDNEMLEGQGRGVWARAVLKLQ